MRWASRPSFQVAIAGHFAGSDSGSWKPPANNDDGIPTRPCWRTPPVQLHLALRLHDRGGRTYYVGWRDPMGEMRRECAFRKNCETWHGRTEPSGEPDLRRRAVAVLLPCGTRLARLEDSSACRRWAGQDPGAGRPPGLRGVAAGGRVRAKCWPRTGALSLVPADAWPGMALITAGHSWTDYEPPPAAAARSVAAGRVLPRAAGVADPPGN